MLSFLLANSMPLRGPDTSRTDWKNVTNHTELWLLEEDDKTDDNDDDEDDAEHDTDHEDHEKTCDAGREGGGDLLCRGKPESAAKMFG